MLTFEFPTCYNCLNFLHKRSLMEPIGEHTFHCPNCGTTKELIAYPKVRRITESIAHKPINLRSLFVGPMSVISTFSFAIALWKLTLPIIAFLSPDWQYIVAALALVEYLMLGVRINQIAWKIDTKKSNIFKP